ncbi:MAG: porin family protein [Saprospiraceae bacterium]
MKKLIVISALLFTLSNQMTAQVSIGVEVGPSFSNMRIQGDGGLLGNTQSFIGVRTGLSFNYNIAPNFDLESGMYYNLTGFTAVQGFNFDLYNINIPADVRAITQIHFLEMPLLLNAKMGNDKVEAYLHAGPQLSYAMDGDIKLRARLFLDFNLGTYDLNLKNNNFRQMELAGVIGAGMNIRLNDKMKFNIGMDYMHGFTDLTKEPIVNITTQRYGINTQLGLKYTF